MRFSNIPGLHEVKAKLIKAVEANHVAHAQMFIGQPGALNLPLALALAQYLHCTNRSDDACGTCPGCSKSNKYIHPDTHFIFPSNNTSNKQDDDRAHANLLKDWRQFLLENPFGDLSDWVSHYKGEGKYPIISREEGRGIMRSLTLKSFESTNKVMIIWQPELMHPSAAHSILKILEEPPAHTFFILVTNAVEKILATIISRTQMVQVPMLTDDELDAYLSKTFDVTEEKRNEIVQLSDGNIALAQSLIHRDDSHFEYFMDWMTNCYKSNYQALVEMANDFHDSDKLAQQYTIIYALNMLHEITMQHAGANSLNRSRGSSLERIEKLSKILQTQKVERFYHHLNEASYHLERNGSAKMIFLDISLQLTKIFRHT